MLLSLRVPCTEANGARKSQGPLGLSQCRWWHVPFHFVCLWGDGGRKGMSCLDQHEPPGHCRPAVPLGCLSSFGPRWMAPTPTLHWALAFFFFKQVAILIVYWAVFINRPKRVSLFLKNFIFIIFSYNAMLVSDAQQSESATPSVHPLSHLVVTSLFSTSVSLFLLCK